MLVHHAEQRAAGGIVTVTGCRVQLARLFAILRHAASSFVHATEVATAYRRVGFAGRLEQPDGLRDVLGDTEPYLVETTEVGAPGRAVGRDAIEPVLRESELAPLPIEAHGLREVLPDAMPLLVAKPQIRTADASICGAASFIQRGGSPLVPLYPHPFGVQVSEVHATHHQPALARLLKERLRSGRVALDALSPL